MWTDIGEIPDQVLWVVVSREKGRLEVGFGGQVIISAQVKNGGGVLGHAERRHALTRERTLLDCCDLVQYKYCIRQLEFMVAIDERTMPGQAV